MTLEESFKLIRDLLDDAIKHYDDTIGQLENYDAIVERDIRNRPNLKDALEVRKKYKSLKEEMGNVVLESKKRCERISQTREFFGKSHILKKVVDFEAFLINLNHINFVLNNSIDNKIIAQIIGMAIYNNNKIYEKKGNLEKDLNSKYVYLRKECQEVVALKPYFREDGTIIANDDVDLFVNSLTALFTVNHDRTIEIEIPKEKVFTVSMLIELLKENLLEVNRNKPKVVEPSNITIKPIVTKMERREIIEQQRLKEQELATYFDGEQILRLCASIEEFEILVNACNLSEENKTRIISKMNTFSNKNSSLEKISFLSMEEQEIYKLALEKQLGNFQVKELIEEIHTLLEMYKEDISNEDKKCIEDEIKTIIERLRFMLNINVKELLLQKKEKES